MQNPHVFQRGRKNENGWWQTLVCLGNQKRNKYGESILESSVLKPWNRMVFITHKQSLEDFLLEISFHEKLKILSFRYRH